MPDLPSVTQEFDANVLPYLEGVEAMISATDAFRESVDEALAAVLALDAAIGALPDEKIINIRVETEGTPEAAATAAGAAPDTAGMADEAAAAREAADAASEADSAFARLDELLKESGGDWAELSTDANEAGASLREAGTDAEEAGTGFHGMAEDISTVGTSLAEFLRDAGNAESGIVLIDNAAKGTTSSFAAVDDAAVAGAEHLGAVGDAAEAATGPFTALGLAARDATVPFAAVDASLKEAGADAEETAAGFGLLGSAATAIVNGFAAVETTWKNTNVVWGLSLNALHWIVMGSMELLAVAVPAMVALGAAGLVAMQGVQETSNRLESIYTVTESLGGAFNVTAGNVLGLKSVLQQAQNAADPLVWEALGAAIQGVKVMGGGFVQMGTQVLQIFDRWAAAVDVELAGAFGSTLTGILSKGAQDATGFGQALGNIGHFIVNLASEMPGLAEVLLGAVAGFTKLLAVMTQPAWYNFGGNLVTVAMGVEEAWRWGGLLSDVLGKVLMGFANLTMGVAGFVGKIGALGSAGNAAATAMETMGGGMATAAEVLSGPWGWVILGAAAGLTLLILKLAETKTAAQQFAAGLEQAINSANVTTGFADVTTGLTSLQTKFAQSTQAAAQAGAQMNTTGTAFRLAGPSMSTAAQDAGTYSEAMTKLTGQGASIISAGAEIASKFGLSVPAAFQAADNAGLKVGTMFQANGQLTAVALQQVENYIKGYQVMSGSSSALGNNISAVNYQLGLQNTDVSKLNSAWDQFMGVVTGGTSSWAALSDDLQQMGNTASAVGGKIQAFTGTTVQGMQQIGKSLTSFGGTSAQVWQNFDAALTQANTVTDWWRTAAASGAAGSTQLTQAIATTTAQFVPYVGSSKTALAETMALAQEAGGPAYNASKSLAQNYQTLKTWTDQNGVSQSKYNALLGTATIQLSNVSQAAQNFSQTLQADVAQAVAAGAVNLNTVTKDTQNFTAALKNNTPQSQAVSGAIDQMATQFHGAGMNAQSAASLVYQLGIDQGLTKKQATDLANEMTTVMNNMNKAAGATGTAGKAAQTAGGQFHTAAGSALALANAINDIPNSKNVLVNVQEALTGTVGVGGIVPSLTGHAAGFRVPGYGGGDVHPALLEGGESVVPKELTPAVAPFLKSHGVPGFEGGGIMGSSGGYGSYGGGGGDRPLHVHLQLDGRELGNALIPSLTAANGRYAVRNSGKATGVWKPV